MPEPLACGLRVGAREARWREGEALVFDDTFVHEVWNAGASERVVLFIDFIRPMRFPLSWINASDPAPDAAFSVRPPQHPQVRGMV